MEVEADEKDLKVAGAEPLPDGRKGLRIHGWEIESRKRSILTSSNFLLWEEKLQISHCIKNRSCSSPQQQNISK
ncbi:hypothetical protein FH972_017289 [Carpinus fangiana]|uniref:Uncharacterized protein n=1 Tax=Carpinus fangiana TaxID=176857 RepID=A0A5N6RJ17_9ROSI|nr:hypothetical protein FH972_017289 [Carpinus fangiana]